MSETPVCACSSAYSHEPHFYVSAIAGGEPGPIPTLTCLCPGRTTPPAATPDPAGMSAEEATP